jgi:hypothetical protein
MSQRNGRRLKNVVEVEKVLRITVFLQRKKEILMPDQELHMGG